MTVSEGDGDNSQRSSSKSLPQHEIDAQITREKMARLRALRLAQEAANGPAVKPTTVRKRAGSKKASGKAPGGTKSLSDWLSTQEKEGRRN
jgi:hypothetical protein